MINSVIFSLIYGPVAVTLACWLFFTIEAGRAKKEVVVRILSQKHRRFHRIGASSTCLIRCRLTEACCRKAAEGTIARPRQVCRTERWIAESCADNLL